MNRRMRCGAAALVLLAFVPVTSGPASAAPRTAGRSRAAVEALVQKVLHARAPGLGEYGALRRAATRADIRRLREHRNEGIAVWAAWQDVCRTVPEEEGPATYRPDRRKVEWFLAVLECRVRADAPEWWRATVCSTWANRRDNFVFSPPVGRLYRATGVGAIEARRGTRVWEARGRLSLASGLDSVPVPPGLIEKEAFLAHRYVSALMVPGRCYLTAHEEIGYNYRLTCLARPSGKVCWQAEVWGSARGDWSGPVLPDHCVTVVEQGDRVLVFGASGWGAYVEGFRAADGRNLFRFSTSD
jgi:hypothetical protein